MAPAGDGPTSWARLMPLLLGWVGFGLFTIVCGAGFDDTALRSRYDVIVMPSGASFRPGGGGRGGGGVCAAGCCHGGSGGGQAMTALPGMLDDSRTARTVRRTPAAGLLA